MNEIQNQNQNQSHIGMLQLSWALLHHKPALQYGLQAWSVVALYQAYQEGPVRYTNSSGQTLITPATGRLN